MLSKQFSPSFAFLSGKKCLITTASSLHDSETFLSVRRQVGKFKVQVSCQDVVAAFPFALETSLAHLLFRRIMKDANKANRKMKMTKMFKTCDINFRSPLFSDDCEFEWVVKVKNPRVRIYCRL